MKNKLSAVFFEGYNPMVDLLLVTFAIMFSYKLYRILGVGQQVYYQKIQIVPLSVAAALLAVFIMYVVGVYKDESSVLNVEEIRNTIKGKSRRINKALDDLDQGYYKLAQGFQGKYNQGVTSKVGQKYDLDKVTEYLKGQRKLETLPKEYRFSAKDIDKQLNELRKGLSEALPNNAQFADFKKDLLNRGNKYMRVSFDIFERPMYQPLVKDKANAVDYVLKKVVRGNKDFREAAAKEFPNISSEAALKKQANRLVDNILYTGRAEKIDPSDVHS